MKTALEFESTFFNFSLDLMVVVKDGYFIHLNHSWERVLGWSIKELESKHYSEFVHPDDITLTSNTAKKIHESNTGEIIENRYLCKNGEYKWLSWSVCVNDGLIYGIARDITEAKLREEKLQYAMLDLGKSNEALDRFAYIVSHDLKAPLKGILLMTQWLGEDKDLSDQAKEYTLMILERVKGMESMVKEILDYAKVGKGTVSIEKVDVGSMLNEIISMIDVSDHIKVCIEIDHLVFNTRKILLYQVFSNLISNAIKYNDKERCFITIKGLERTKDYLFEVADNGPGIPSEYKEDIFRIFKTIKARETRDSTGIGLSIVKKIVEEEYNGRIWVESEEGKGAKFIFTWPKALN